MARVRVTLVTLWPPQFDWWAAWSEARLRPSVPALQCPANFQGPMGPIHNQSPTNPQPLTFAFAEGVTRSGPSLPKMSWIQTSTCSQNTWFLRELQNSRLQKKGIHRLEQSKADGSRPSWFLVGLATGFGRLLRLFWLGQQGYGWLNTPKFGLFHRLKTWRPSALSLSSFHPTSHRSQTLGVSSGIDMTSKQADSNDL